jgi:hypothetical protein
MRRQKLSEVRGEPVPKADDPVHGEIDAPRVPRRDLSDVTGTWIDDPAFDAAVAEQDIIWPGRETAKPDNTAGEAHS